MTGPQAIIFDEFPPAILHARCARPAPPLPPVLPPRRAALRGGSSHLAQLTAIGGEWFEEEHLRQNARALWHVAGALGLHDELRAARAAEVRANGGLIT